MTFGYHRAEILGALASIFTIWILVGILCYEAVIRLIDDVHRNGTAVDGRIMTIIGIAGLVVNIIDAFILNWGNAPHGHSHSHGHGHQHQNEINKQKKESKEHENINVRAAFIHVLGDCLQSVGVIAASVFIWVGNVIHYGAILVKGSYWNLADPIASLVFGIITLITTVKLCKNVIEVLMEQVPAEIDYKLILKDLKSIPGITDVHDLHIWAISIGKVSLSAHIHSDDHEGALIAAQEVCRNHGITHTTIQVDPGPPSSTQCSHTHGVH